MDDFISSNSENQACQLFENNSETENIIFLRRKKVEEITGLSRSSIYANMADGTFPKNVMVGTKGVRWVQSEIHEWCLKKIKDRT